MLKLGALSRCTGLRPVLAPAISKPFPAAKVVLPRSSCHHSSTAPNSRAARTRVVSFSFQDDATGGTGREESPLIEGYVEAKVDSVRVSQGASVVMLRLVGHENRMLPVHIGEAESSALLKELNKTKQIRPLTHDFAKTLLQAAGFKVTKIRITELVSSTYFSRVHIARYNNNSVDHEVDVDARPSDAINLAMRFAAPIYVSAKIAEIAVVHSPEVYTTTTATSSSSPSSHSETNSQIEHSVREALASFEDPTVMFQLHKSLAVQEQRFEDAAAFQQRIYYEMTHNQLLRLVVAMEAALGDGRFEEAARLRDEYKRLSSVVAAENKKSTY